MNFFKKGLEYNKLAQAFNGHYQMLQQVIEKSKHEDVAVDIHILAFIGRKEIIDRMEIINYKMETRIIVPMMPGENKTLAYAYHQTIGVLMELGMNQGCLEKVQNILDKGDLYFELEKTIPSHIKTMMNL